MWHSAKPSRGQIRGTEGQEISRGAQKDEQCQDTAKEETGRAGEGRGDGAERGEDWGS